MLEVLGTVLLVIICVFLVFLEIGAAYLNLWERENEYERQIQQTDKKSDKR